MRQALLAVFLGFCLAIPGMAAPSAPASQIQVNAGVNFGLGFSSNSSVFSYNESTATTAKFNSTIPILVPFDTDNQTIDLSTLFSAITTPLVLVVSDVTDGGQAVSIGLVSGGTRFPLSANGFMLIRVNGSLPTLYVDNESADTDCTLAVSVIGN